MLTQLLFYGCQTSKSIYSSQSCGLERLEWQEVTTKKNKRTNTDTNLELEGSGQNLVGKAKGAVNSDIKVFKNTQTNKTVSVSKEFYEDYSRKRAALCDIYKGISDGTIKTESGKVRAETLYLDIVALFAGISVEKKQENQNPPTPDPCITSRPFTRGEINNQQGVNEHATGTLTINGKIDDHSTGILVSDCGDVVIGSKIDGQSNFTINAPKGNVSVGWDINGKSIVKISCAGNITIQGKVDGESQLELIAGGVITITGEVENPLTTVRYKSPGTIDIRKKIVGRVERFN
jgi:hypothetical protein